MQCPEQRTVNLTSCDADSVSSLEYSLDFIQASASTWTFNHYFLGSTSSLHQTHLYLALFFFFYYTSNSNYQVLLFLNFFEED